MVTLKSCYLNASNHTVLEKIKEKYQIQYKKCFRPAIFLRDSRRHVRSELTVTKEFQSSCEGEVMGRFRSAQAALQALEGLRNTNDISYSLFASVKHAVCQISCQRDDQKCASQELSVEFILQKNGKLMAIVD